MDRARPQGAGSNLIEGRAVTTTAFSQISISKWHLSDCAAFRRRATVDLGNGILPPETRRRVQPREADRPAKWPSQTALDPAKPIKSRDFGALGTTVADQDFLVELRSVELV